MAAILGAAPAAANAIMCLRLLLVLVIENGPQIEHEQEHPPSPGYGVAGEHDYEEERTETICDLR